MERLHLADAFALVDYSGETHAVTAEPFIVLRGIHYHVAPAKGVDVIIECAALGLYHFTKSYLDAELFRELPEAAVYAYLFFKPLILELKVEIIAEKTLEIQGFSTLSTT